LGELILNLVMETLARAGFTVREAFPGQTAGLPPRPVAALELQKLEGSRVTVTVHVLSPAAQGGSACESAALSAFRALETVGAECTLFGCEYDGNARVFRTRLEAKFLLGAQDVSRDSGFQVWLDEQPLPWVKIFRGERIRKQAPAEPPLESGEFTEETPYWEFYLEEVIPQDSVKPELPDGEFVLRVLCGNSHEVYSGCSCASIFREYTREGLKQVSKGMCRSRTVRIGG
jgi:hypothetical protein